jgi:hypothetical protein
LCKAIKIQEWAFGNQNNRFVIKLQCSIVRYKLLVFWSYRVNYQNHILDNISR